MEQPKLTNREIRGWALVFAVATIVIHIPFLLRYDLYFQSGIAVSILQCKRLMMGEFSIYCWGTDYAGISPFDFLAAALYKVFGFSIPLGGLASLVAWALGVGLLTAYVAMCFGKRAGILSGCALAIGVPHMTLYSTQALYGYAQTPLLIGGFIWLTVLWIRKGPQSKLGLLVGLLMGYYWYVHKQVLIVWLAIGVTLFLMPQGRKFLKDVFTSRMAVLVALAFLVGYSPEILYKMGFFDHEGRLSDSAGFFQLATPEKMARNWYMIFRCLPTCFDADPWSRAAAGVHYLNHMENWESFPLQPADTVGILVAVLVITFGVNLGIRSYKQKNLEVFLLLSVPLVDMILIIISSTADGSYYKIRRYMMPAGIVFLALLGIRLAEDWSLRRWLSCGVLGLLLVISSVHQMDLIEAPDELKDYRKTVTDIEASGYKYGASWFSFAHTLTALSDERVVFGILDHSTQSPYQKNVMTQDVVVVVWPAVNPPPFEFAQTLFFGGIRFKDDQLRMLPEEWPMFGRTYKRIGEPKINGELGWAPYRAESAAFHP